MFNTVNISKKFRTAELCVVSKSLCWLSDITDHLNYLTLVIAPESRKLLFSFVRSLCQFFFLWGHDFEKVGLNGISRGNFLLMGTNYEYDGCCCIMNSFPKNNFSVIVTCIVYKYCSKHLS